MKLTFTAYHQCVECRRYALTPQAPDGHRRWVGTSLRHCGPYEPIRPVTIEVTPAEQVPFHG